MHRKTKSIKTENEEKKHTRHSGYATQNSCCSNHSVQAGRDAILTGCRTFAIENPAVRVVPVKACSK